MMLKCIGCGYCCWEAPCSTAMELHGPIKICPELVWDGRRYRCKIIDLRREKGLANEFCCRPLNKWRLSIKQRKHNEI